MGGLDCNRRRPPPTPSFISRYNHGIRNGGYRLRFSGIAKRHLCVTMITETLIQQVADHLRVSQRLMILTGAGISSESGVPTFRDSLEGLWSRYDPAQLATPDAFRRDPTLVWSWYAFRRAAVRRAQPNPGHHALAEIQRRQPQAVLITQNVDDLHERAGSRAPIHLHGNIARSKCAAACRGEPTHIELPIAVSEAESAPPPCPYCGAPARPDVVWFGEMLPPAALTTAHAAAARADVCLVVGTSGVVVPAAHLPLEAKAAGAFVIEVNPVESAITPHADVWLSAPAGEILPRVVEAL